MPLLKRMFRRNLKLGLKKKAKIQTKIDGLNKSAAKAKSDKLKSESAAKEAGAAAGVKNTPAPEVPVEAATESTC